MIAWHKCFIIALIVCLLPNLAGAAEPPFDLVLRGGKVVDGTGNPWFLGDVAIRGERIVAVARRPRTR